MAIVETESLILKSYSLAEADKIVVFLTQEHGLVKGVAKGAKRLKSRFGGGLEPFTIVNLTYFQKEERELVSISHIELQKSFFSNAVNPEFLQKFAYLSELIIEFAPPNDPNAKLYRMAKACLETASRENSYLESIVLYFELWVLRLAGYLPNWSICDGCRNEINKNENANLQINFHLLCSSCLQNKNRVSVSPRERYFYLLAQNVSPINFVKATFEKNEEVKGISLILKRIISHILGKDNVGERVIFAPTP